MTVAVFADASTTQSPASTVHREHAACPRSDDRYDDVNDMFRALAATAHGSPRWACQREEIVIRCLPLAEHIARRFASRGLEFDDLVQVARVGLLGAINRFDVDAGSEFLAFAVPTIMGEVRRHFRDRGWAMRVPRRLKDLNVGITKTIPLMTQRLGRAPTASELAAELDVGCEEVMQSLMARDCYLMVSLDSPRNRDDDSDAMGRTIGGPDSSYELVVDRETLRRLIVGLSDRQRAVLGMRFFESMTQSQIAERIGTSQMHVSRILARTLAQLRAEMC